MEQDKTLLLQLGERVKALRVTRGLSQEELAERAGMSLKHLGEIERAATEPSITAVLGLCKGLEVRVLELLPDAIAALDQAFFEILGHLGYGIGVDELGALFAEVELLEEVL